MQSCTKPSKHCEQVRSWTHTRHHIFSPQDKFWSSYFGANWHYEIWWHLPLQEVSLFRDELDDQNEPIQKHDKWIVVTTIQAPTPAMKALAEIPGWKMVVVGDKKTPPWSWVYHMHERFRLYGDDTLMSDLTVKKPRSCYCVAPLLQMVMISRNGLTHWSLEDFNEIFR